MPPKKVVQYKGKILFLHGYTQTSSIFYAKTSALRKRLTKLNYKSVYLNGPLKLTPADLPSNDELSKFNTVVASDSEETNYRAWWVKPHKSNDGIDLEEGIATIRNYIKNGVIIPDEDMKEEPETEEERKLPIAGVVGFSQGAALGGIIAHKFKELFDTPSPKFFILYSGFKLDTSKSSGNDKYESHYPDPEESIDFKFLHVYGELDTVVDETRALSLYEATKSSSDLLKHPGGHFVPNSKLFIDQVTNWIQITEKEDEEGKGNNEQKKEEDDLDSLMDMMDNLGKA
ncbi:dihydrofolate reductase [Scheffersomyces xylosifermentans]|uniref:dihydrofolate reductase n=1 Tax=Scheffersomyces xylosifermentans TaxID=1304137 RepID=UPI00315DB741